MFDMLKRFWQKRKPTLAAVYPLGLTRPQVDALREWVASPAYEAFQHVVAEMARTRLTQLLSASPDKVEFTRGAMASLNECHSVIGTILHSCEALDDRTRSNGSKHADQPAKRHLGSANFW